MYLDDIVTSQHLGISRGIPSICSAHPWVLRAALVGEAPVLIESTCNQVNQYGGYTGLTPLDFAAFVRGIATQNGYPPENIILGGDHLGPSVWVKQAAEDAMQKAEVLLQAYVTAGYQKIHLDTSMHLGGDDPAQPLDLEVAAGRAARLAAIAEQACTASGITPPYYVIGTEVPPPGGAPQPEERVLVTDPQAVQQTIDATRQAFFKVGIEPAWERVIAVVVQPGVEFGDDFVLDYQPKQAIRLVQFIEKEARLVYEAHSTDYQSRESLHSLVEDHFAILKVGPALTFAMREAVFGLALIETELFPEEQRSNLLDTLETAMLRQPDYWQKYYPGTPSEQVFKRKYSLSDRIRYYWPQPDVQAALERLLQNLRLKPIPRSLISQYLPKQSFGVCWRLHNSTPEALILERIGAVLMDYHLACQ